MSSPEDIRPSTSERMGLVRPLTAKERFDQLSEMGRREFSPFSISATRGGYLELVWDDMLGTNDGRGVLRPG